ncbi:MAG: copper resistance protein NlpE [Muribaculaceae bacterium]|nr:copper resistance protein NlpE [Muribaculaceae bacterium]
MKKIMLYAAAALALTACGNRKAGAVADGSPASESDEYLFYEGVLPAADAAGVRYSLALDYDDDNPARGDYKLTETYLKADGSATSSFYSEGDFDVRTGTPADSLARYLVLVPEVEAGATPGATLYFLAESDSTMTMVNADFSRSETPGLNYTIARVAELTR